MYKKFWMCYVEGTGVPQQRHRSVVNAQIEAERLARKEGKVVYLLEAINTVYVKPPDPPVLPVVWDRTE